MVLTNAQICTLSSEGPATCGADSGNALIYQGQQVGIVSSGVPCGKGRPDLFTNVVFQNDWITRSLNELKIISNFLLITLRSSLIG